MPGKVTIYKRTVTKESAFSNPGYVFGLTIILNESNNFSQNDFVSMIDESGAVILSPRTLCPDPSSSYAFSDSNTSLLTYGGTFYLIVWGESNIKGIIQNFPAVVIK